jgi:hypothetical protein
MGTPRPGSRSEVPFPVTVIGVPACTVLSEAPINLNARLLIAEDACIFCPQISHGEREGCETPRSRRFSPRPPAEARG